MNTKNLLAKIKPVEKPLLILLMILFVITLGFFFFYKRLVFLRKEIKIAQEQNKLYTDRIATLQTVKPDVDSDSAQTALFSLPSQNPSLLIISQVNNLLADFDLNLTHLELSVSGSTNPEESLSQAIISLNVDGTYQNIADFLTKLANITPLVNIQKADLSQTGENTEALFELTGYWSPFPSQLPPLTTAISGLTDEEKETLRSLSAFITPSFTEDLTPRNYEPHPNPFGETINPEESL
jgi:Tfp pilus assembly protein PilO